jgi:hypothetical protein
VLNDIAAGDGATVVMLGRPGGLSWRKEGNGILIVVPAAAPTGSQHARTLKLTGVRAE